MRYWPLALAVLFLAVRRLTMSAIPDEDTESAARMLIAETGARGSAAELESIVQVAVNRADKDGVSVADVVGPPGRSSRGVWNNSEQFKADFENAHNRGLSWVRALEIAQRVTAGTTQNRIGTRLHFIHAANFPPCTGPGQCDSGRESQRGRERWQCIETPSGWRCVPSWAAVDPVSVGRATFSSPS